VSSNKPLFTAGPLLLVAGCTLVAILSYSVIPAFAKIYVGFEIPLPWQTRVLVAVYPYAFVLPLSAVAIAFAARANPLLRARLLPFSLAVTVLLCGFMYWAAYAPIESLHHP
jgi:hypothetical protein